MTSFETTRWFATKATAIHEAFSDPSKLALWWGPNGFRNEFQAFDFAPGGQWKFVMVGPDGARYDNLNRFLQVNADHIQIEHINHPHFVLTIRLSPEGDGTRLSWQQILDDDQFAESVRHIIEPANEQNLDRLAKLLGVASVR